MLDPIQHHPLTTNVMLDPIQHHSLSENVMLDEIQHYSLAKNMRFDPIQTRRDEPRRWNRHAIALKFHWNCIELH